MNDFKKNMLRVVGLSLIAFFLSTAAAAQQIKRTPFDVTNYVMDVQLVPNENKLNATVDVNFVPFEDTRTVSFELNGSLKIESITRQNSPAARRADDERQNRRSNRRVESNHIYSRSGRSFRFRSERQS